MPTVHRIVTAETVEEYILPILGSVDLDPCSHAQYVVPSNVSWDGDQEDGCQESWVGVGKSVWLFPPTRSEEKHKHTLDQWVSKAYREFTRGATVLALLPSSTGSSWFHDFVTRSAAFTLLRHSLGVETVGGPLRMDRPQLSVLWTRDMDTLARYSSVSTAYGPDKLDLGLLVENA